MASDTAADVNLSHLVSQPNSTFMNSKEEREGEFGRWKGTLGTTCFEFSLYKSEKKGT